MSNTVIRKLRTISEQKENNIKVIKSLFAIEERGPKYEYYINDDNGENWSITKDNYEMLLKDNDAKNYIRKFKLGDNGVISRTVDTDIQIVIEQDNDSISEFHIDTNIFENRLDDLSEATVIFGIIDKSTYNTVEDKTYKFPKFTDVFRKAQALDILNSLYDYVKETVNIETQEVSMRLITNNRDSQTGMFFFTYYGIGDRGVLKYV